ncbi:uncharacterized protein B0I36DRAFT_310408 [Microdochium trichocladiopsis]|uniref:Uncharacterized protein n=1 Tax=Microdochium trichocladiopsis TaxID=1682393 RepID=A0A9P8YHV8_9PEZI|nr:uncharacterized protein B0I36DRAFT_310408 [Microdochium trichocladiopsis]KAH7040298.1 hypothetical protein B0I36DRAFT_310408 [Microdochium trichocladiopsis]
MRYPGQSRLPGPANTNDDNLATCSRSMSKLVFGHGWDQSSITTHSLFTAPDPWRLPAHEIVLDSAHRFHAGAAREMSLLCRVTPLRDCPTGTNSPPMCFALRSPHAAPAGAGAGGLDRLLRVVHEMEGERAR